jgi:hypothetical protein
MEYIHKMKRIFIVALGMFALVLRIEAQSSPTEAAGQQSFPVTWSEQNAALRDISDAVKNNDSNSETLDTLEYLGLAGTVNILREDRRVINNFPDIRAKCANYLGNLGTGDEVKIRAKNILLKMLLVDREPWVLGEIINSLAKIGINDEEETTRTIAWVVKRFDFIAPDDALAKSALDAFDTFARNNNGTIHMEALDVIERIQNGSYIRLVQERASKVLENIKEYSGNGDE